MRNSEQQWVAMIQLNYPPGTRLVLDHMDDPYAPVESGTRGSVQAVDDAVRSICLGTMVVPWPSFPEWIASGS